MGQTPFQIYRVPLAIETELDDGAYDEPHIDSSVEYKKCGEIFTEKQMQDIAQLVPLEEIIEIIRINDYTYFSSTGSKFGRIRVELYYESGGNKVIYEGTSDASSGKPLVVSYCKLDFIS